MAMTYTWSAFDLTKALNGAVVGIENTEASYDLSKTGHIYPSGNIFGLRIEGVLLKLKSDGTIVSSSDATTIPTTTTLKIVTTEMLDEAAVGTGVTRSSDPISGHTNEAVISSVEPRDAFAMNVLNAMMVNMKSPESFDDATKLMYSRAAYKWAQAMMIAAADGREGQVSSGGSSTPVDINTGDLQSNTETLLYNLNESLKVVGDQLKSTGAIGSAVNMIDSRLAEVCTIANVGHTIAINVSIYQTKYLRFEFQTDMAFSDISVKVGVTISGSQQSYGFIIPKGSVIVVESLEAEVTAIDSISSPAVRGRGSNDPNTYSISIPT